jgi:hypothetical protein
VLRFLVWAISAALRLRALLVAENVCLRQQLGVLQRRHRQPPAQWGPAVLDLCESMVRRLAQFASYREARDSSEVAPFRAPRANAISERWVKSVRAECLDHLLIFNEAGLRRIMASYVSYFNHWRPHRSLRQRAPCDSTVLRSRAPSGKIIAANILGGLHHAYWRAA